MHILTYKTIARMAGYIVKKVYTRDEWRYYWKDERGEDGGNSHELFPTPMGAYMDCCIVNHLIDED